MYRIKFVTKGGFWVVQFMILGVFWRTVQVKKAVPSTNKGILQKYEVMSFTDIEAAEKYVEERGIDRAYDRKEASFSFHQQQAQVVQMVPLYGPMQQVTIPRGGR